MSFASLMPSFDRANETVVNVAGMGAFIGGLSLLAFNSASSPFSPVQSTVGGGLFMGAFAWAQISGRGGETSWMRNHTAKFTLAAAALGGFIGYTDGERKFEEHRQIQMARPVSASQSVTTNMGALLCGNDRSHVVVGRDEKGQLIKLDCSKLPQP